jgi:ppGpp synthetase/RelA/SpoT-type nucleotidyltranferase
MHTDPSVLKSHAEQSLLAYVRVRDKYAAFASAIRIILESALSNYSIHTIQARAKDFDSFAKKSIKIDRKTGGLKYPDPLKEITDLAGVRVIAYIQQTVKDVEEVIRNEFSVQERLDKDAALLDEGRIGYKSIHFLVKLKDPRVSSPEYSQFQEMVAEIQVRTILQHSWAEMEHDIQYKSDQQIPNELRRRFIALAGLLEITDREFESIQREDDRLRTMLAIELVEEISKLPPENYTAAAAAIPSAEAPPSGTHAQTGPPDLIYTAALERYNNLIQSQPGQYAHVLGRAKAKFLLGDRSGALEDVAKASELAPGNEHVTTVRQQIEEGRVNEKGSYQAAISKYMSLGNSFLEQGNVSEAFANYSKGEQLGARRKAASLAFAMCACLRKDLVEVLRHLGKVVPAPGSYEQINHLLVEIVTRQFADTPDPTIDERRALLTPLLLKTQFDLENSPLRYLRGGLQSTLGETGTKQLNDLLVVS